MSRIVRLIVISSISLASFSCQSKSTVESTPVELIEVSAPPVEEQEPPPVVLYDDFGVRLPDEWRVYGAIVPKGYKDVRRSEKDISFYVDGMAQRDVERFLNKYFPYQPREYTLVHQMFEVLPSIKEDYKDGSIVPDLNPNVYRPDPPVYIRVLYDRDRQEMLWIYSDPGLSARQEENAKADCKNCAQEQNVDQKLEESITPDQVEKICILCRTVDPNDIKTRELACKDCREMSKKFGDATIQKYRLFVDDPNESSAVKDPK